jgi:hypothetical protein
VSMVFNVVIIADSVKDLIGQCVVKTQERSVDLVDVETVETDSPQNSLAGRDKIDQ